ncbi:hypothetical protein OSTOST_17840, partial [Ostertagia ostertagi]
FLKMKVLVESVLQKLETSMRLEDLPLYLKNAEKTIEIITKTKWKGHTPFLSPSLRLYDDLCSPPGTSGDGSTTTHDLAVFGGFCSQNRNDFGVTIASPKRSKSV